MNIVEVVFQTKVEVDTVAIVEVQETTETNLFQIK